MLKRKFKDVFDKTFAEIKEEYTRDVISDESMKYALGHAENIKNKFWKYFNQVCDLHRIIKYVKMKSKRFGRERIEYAKKHMLPEYSENLINACLRFLKNYYGEIESMKILLTA